MDLEDREDGFRGAADGGLAAMNDNGALYQHGMSRHGLDDGIIPERGLIQPEFLVSRFAFPEQLPWAQSECMDDVGQLHRAWR